VLAYNKKDPDLAVDKAIGDGDVIEGTEFRLEVLHTPVTPRTTCASSSTRSGSCSPRHDPRRDTPSSPEDGRRQAKYMATLERLRKMRLSKIARSR
jgi:hypothetical protein